MTRLEESLTPQLRDGSIRADELAPTILVGARPAFENTRTWFPGEALAFASRVFGRENLRACEACMNPRLYVEPGRLEHNSVLSLEEIKRIDADNRGAGPAARAAVWIDETHYGVAVRVVSLDNGSVLFAGNYDGAQREEARSGRNFNATLDLQRRLRGESLTHIFIDAAVYPGLHISSDVVEQFGAENENLAGITLSFTDPFLGLGATYYRVIPVAWDINIGGQVVVSLPSALATAFTGEPTDVIDPILTAVLVARWPIPETNFAIVATASTNGVVGVGISLMNFTLLPVLP